MLKGLFTKKPPLAVAITSHALRFEMARGKTLLEAAQDAGIGFPCVYSYVFTFYVTLKFLMLHFTLS